ncbi:MAG: hypothetical protein KAQ64_01230 [Candidatus Pacebacteria bacterium]|nr:hypothetical protein [Candidatus Paceibacterota bacterium]
MPKEEEISPEEIDKIVDEMLSCEDKAMASMHLNYIEEDDEVSGRTGEARKSELVRETLNETEEGRKLITWTDVKREENKQKSQNSEN